MRVVPYTIAAAVVAALAAVPAHATCMEHVDRAGVRVYSCSAPGGPVTTYVCVHETCTP